MAGNVYTGFVFVDPLINGQISPGTGIGTFRVDCYRAFNMTVTWDCPTPPYLTNITFGELVADTTHYSNQYAWRLRFNGAIDKYCSTDGSMNFYFVQCGSTKDSDHNGKYCPLNNCDCCPNGNASCQACKDNSVCPMLYSANSKNNIFDLIYLSPLTFPMFFGFCVDYSIFCSGGNQTIQGANIEVKLIVIAKVISVPT